MYKHLEAGWILRVSDGAHIPPDQANRDYAEFLSWVADGGVADPYVPPVPSPALRHISVGAFFDRFGAQKWAILADATPSVQALVKDCSVRKYIDLARADLPTALALLQSAGHAIDATEILAAPVQYEELP